jgi:hypothetical protein
MACKTTDSVELAVYDVSIGTNVIESVGHLRGLSLYEVTPTRGQVKLNWVLG